MNRAQRLLGINPAALSGLIAAGISLAITFGLHLSSEQEALIMAAVTAVLGVYTAWVTTGTQLSLIVGAAKSLLALGVGFGLPLTSDQTGAVIAFLTLALGFFNHTQNSPMSAGRGFMGDHLKAAS